MICAFFQRSLDIIFVADSKRSFEYYVTLYTILCKVNLKYLLLPQIDRSNKIYYNAVVSLKN